MSSGNDTLLRQWLMLRLIPRYPRKAEAKMITERLQAEGHSVSKRTVERDLQALSRKFPLALDDREKPFGWSWNKNAPNFDVPGMAPAEALTFMLAREHLKPFFPSAMLRALDPYFKMAEKTLSQVETSGHLARWTEKIATVAPVQPLIPASCDEKVMHVVHEGLLRERQLDVDYKSRSAGKAQVLRVHPLGLVLRGAVTYLVCTLFTYDDLRMLAVHRVKSAKMTEEQSQVPRGFSLQAFIDSGAFGFQSKGMIQLIARFEASAAEHLHETPLSKDQTIHQDKDGWVTVTASVLDTQQLRWWLMGFGDQMEVLMPSRLRDEMKASATCLAVSYNN